MAKSKSTLDWFSYAQRDFIGAKALYELGENFFALSVFHSQQAAEKAIKGYLNHKKIRVPKTHAFEDLLTLVGLKDKNLERKLEGSVDLGIYAIAYRYPSAQAKELTSQMVLHAISLAEQILRECSQEVDKEEQ